MNQIASKCDKHRVLDYLNERLPPSQQLEFEAHLAQCIVCRAELDRLAADPDTWREAAELLRPCAHAALGNDSTPYRNGKDDRLSEDSPDRVDWNHVTSVLDLLTPTDDPEMLGRLGEYEISGVIGVGGMGAVLKGFDRSLRRVVAVKVMAPHLAGSGSARARFQREARAAAAITHDNVIDIYGVSEANGLPYLVMPYAKGPSLQKRIDRDGPLDVAEVVRIGRQVASGLAAAHEQGLVHRDIKPANILLINDGIERLCITDFGVARAIDDASMTNTGLIAGTPQYMSPEQARGETVDRRSDLFSLGSVLYTACTGRPPFRSESAYGILRRITDSEPRPIHEINPAVPDWLCQVIARLMAKHPADRFESAQEVAELLDTCLSHMQRPSDVALPDVLVMHRPRHRHVQPSPHAFRFIRTGVLVMLALLGFAASWGLFLQVTSAPSISGTWSDEQWSTVSLASHDQSPDWYAGTFKAPSGEAGSLQLRWSRLQRRFNGEWRSGENMFGTITVRQANSNRLLGAIAVDPAAETPADVPRLREFTWQEATNPIEAADVQEGGGPSFAGPAKGTAATTGGQAASSPYGSPGASVATQGRQATSPPNNVYSTAASTSATGGFRADVGSFFGPASELAKRLREAREGLREVSGELAASEANHAEAEERLQTAVKGLSTLQAKAKTDSEGIDVDFSDERLSVLQRNMREAQRALESGEEQRVALRARLGTLRLQLAEADAERETILKMLQVERTAASNNLESARTLLKYEQMRSEAGDTPTGEVIKSRQDVEKLEAAVNQLELLINYYQAMGGAADASTGGYPPTESASGLPRPATSSERSATANLLGIQLEGARRELDHAQAEFDRTKALHAQGLLSQGELDRLQLAVQRARDRVKEALIKYDFVRSLSLPEASPPSALQQQEASEEAQRSPFE